MPALRDRLLTAAAWAAAMAVVGAFLWLMADIVLLGAGSLSWSFLIETPRDAGRAGGIGPIIVSTLLIVGVCVVVAIPVGLGAATMLAEQAAAGGGAGRAVRTSLGTLAAVPSIVFGLFGSAFFGRVLGLGFSILSGGLTLACMVLPLVISTAEQALRAVPLERRLAASALGLSRLTTWRRLLLPSALLGIAAGLVLAIGRAVAETAALLFTAGYVMRMPRSLLDSGRTLSVHIYDLAMNVPGSEGNAYAAALVLTAVVLALSLTVSALSFRLRREGGE